MEELKYIEFEELELKIFEKAKQEREENELLFKSYKRKNSD